MKSWIRKIKKDEKAVSPVIGVILMVAITVILAGVIASFVFGFGQKMGTAAPNAQLVLSDAVDELTSTGNENIFYMDHNGGDALPCKDLRILVYYKQTGSLYKQFDYDESNDYFYSSDGITGSGMGSNDLFEPGERITFTEDGDTNWGAGTYTVKVLHIPSGNFIFTGDVTVR
ncbi:archaeal flagellin N-terminal-like domain protein [Archaeoglobus sulfaticallidus PM70-1]|uniref:Archaeal flagellin N-terminal-like domain protein n=1 Tax=Archaeoglobus sulfaticallidus PM70-1 TaxID=387631 RepID=N0BEK4_9EURY|nr:type IV pilin N-terminal domain-containing protein [Archaeoglobus sulfaticallidus]AGK61443.1 archaeal flagellin N-terminal-like domain protein [Archaeoglobus sulfaticallidus PM70-1]